MQILVVDDDYVMRETMTLMLRTRGYQVAAAAHGKAALDYLAGSEQLPQLILLDMAMPVMDGRTFRGAQLADARVAHIPVVVLSGEPDLDKLQQELAVAHILPKPAGLLEVLAAIQQYG